MLDPAREEFPQPRVSPEIIAKHGLTSDEYQKIVKALGREPNYTELGVFSVMWSEHCSYKSSRYYLKNLPTEGPYVLQGPGENAGVRFPEMRPKFSGINTDAGYAPPRERNSNACAAAHCFSLR